MLQNVFSLRQFWLTKLSFFVHNTKCNALYIHPRLDSILALSRAFTIDIKVCIYVGYLPTPVFLVGHQLCDTVE